MFRLLIVTTLFAVAISDGFLTAVSAAEPEQTDSAATLQALREEVRSLKLKVDQLQRQVAELQAASAEKALPVLDFELEGLPLQLPAQVPPVVIEFPPAIEPSRRMTWPLENYDRGLYVFPGFDAPEQEYHGPR